MSEQSQLGPSMEGTVMLDIGADIGALVLHTSAAMAGAEIELSAEVPGAPRTHVAVRERVGSGPSRYAAIYPSLRAGRYTVWGTDGDPAGHVSIVGGHVVELNWQHD